MATVLFTEKDVKDYIDTCIRLWRRKYRDSIFDEDERLVAACYVDAYQSVRTSLFGETLPITDSERS